MVERSLAMELQAIFGLHAVDYRNYLRITVTLQVLDWLKSKRLRCCWWLDFRLIVDLSRCHNFLLAYHLVFLQVLTCLRGVVAAIALLVLELHELRQCIFI